MSDEENYNILIDDSNSSYIYIGKAPRGVLTSTSSWQIQRIEIQASPSLYILRWANKSDSFSKKWDDRTTYTYTV